MSQITINLPDDVANELKDRDVSAAAVNRWVVQAIKLWLEIQPDVVRSIPDETRTRTSPFSESAVPFADQLIKDNRALFERLARLEDEPR